MTFRGRLLILFVAALPLAVNSSCARSGENEESGKPKEGAARGVPAPGSLDTTPIELYENYAETGDLAAIKKRGKLRLLVDPSHSASLHRKATQRDAEIEQVRLMARGLGLELVVLEVPQFSDLIPMLKEGRGDMIASNLLITSDRQQLVDFSTPIADTEVVLVSEVDTEEAGEESDLSGKTLVVTAGTEFERIAREFVKKHPGLKLKVREDNHIDLLVDVALGREDLTIVDTQALELVRQFRPNLKVSQKFSGRRHRAWAVRKNSPRLLQALNAQVRLVRLGRPGQRSRGDLGAIKKRGVIRAVTRNHPGTYFHWKGQALGFEYGLLQNYAEKLGVRLEVTVAKTHDDFVRLLRRGDVDICASLLAITPRRRAEGIAFSEPYLASRIGIVARRGHGIDTRSDLAGRTLCVRKPSRHFSVARELKRDVTDLKLRVIRGELDMLEVIDLVIKKDCDLAIADEISVRLKQAWHNDVTFALALQREETRYAWMVREENPRLLQSINAFFAEPSTDDQLPQLYKRYFDAPRQETKRLNPEVPVSPCDGPLRAHADKARRLRSSCRECLPPTPAAARYPHCAPGSAPAPASLPPGWSFRRGN